MLTSYLEYPINFPGAQQHSTVNNLAFLTLCLTAMGLQETGIAIEDALAPESSFLRWLRTGKKKDELAKRLENGDKFMKVISSTKLFYWKKEGETCFRRRVVIVQISAQDNSIIKS